MALACGFSLLREEKKNLKMKPADRWKMCFQSSENQSRANTADQLKQGTHFLFAFIHKIFMFRHETEHRRDTATVC